MSDYAEPVKKSPDLSHLKQLSADLTAKGVTAFQLKVYLATARIPRGETRSYSDIAEFIGSPKSARAVGSALKKNPFPGEQVPCHRVIHRSGRVEGYLGSLDPNSKENQKKRLLLAREK